MKNSLLGFLFTLFLLFSLAAQQLEAAQAQPGKPALPREAIGRGEVKEALTELETKALEAERNNNWGEAARFYNQASAAARDNGQLQKAVAYATKALELGEKIGEPRLQAPALFQLAFAYRLLGQVEKSVELLKRGIEIAKQIPPDPFKEAIEGVLYRELGFTFLRQGKTEEAIDYISYAAQALDSRLAFLNRVATKEPPPRQMLEQAELLVVSTLERLGTAYERAGNTQEAIKSYERGLSMLKQSGLSFYVEANLYGGLGQLYLRQKDYPRALENLQKGLEIAEKLNHANFIYQASSQIGNLLLQTQKPNEAITYYRKAIENIESTRALLESEEFRSSFFEDKREVYAGIILTHLQTKNLEEAFNYNERARSRAFLDILGSRVQLSRGTELLAEERALQERISTLQAKMADESDLSQRGRLRQELGAAQKAYNNFLVKVRGENKEQASLMNVEPLTLKQVQELLDPGVTILEYFVPRGRLMLWVVEKDKVSFVRISINRADLIPKVTGLRDSISKVEERDKFKAYSQELYRLLIEPALPYIKGKELLIIPHDVLHYLPFQALLSGQERYLIQDYPIYYLSSASLMKFTKEKRRASRENVLVLGNPSLGDEAYNLRFAEREAREVARVFPKSDIFLRDQATKGKAISHSSKHDILHFAVHGELKEDDPLSSGLLLAGDEGQKDGLLKVNEIFSLNLQADTVVLSACETGLGKITSGDEIIGLTRAFIYAGTPSVITTLWKVNDRASYELMREFYTNLKTQKKSEALRQAQLKVMKEFAHPFFWAAYGLTGEP